MDTREVVEFVGVQAALVAAGLHLVRGIEGSVVYLQAGLLTDVRPFLFVLSALAIVLGVVHRYLGDPSRRSRRRLYAFFVVVLFLYLVGYIVWHSGGHPIVSPEPGTLISVHYHVGDPVSNILSHLRNDAFALVNAVVEVVGILAFGWLLVGEPAD